LWAVVSLAGLTGAADVKNAATNAAVSRSTIVGAGALSRKKLM
jgi:hypothetical protein